MAETVWNVVGAANKNSHSFLSPLESRGTMMKSLEVFFQPLSTFEKSMHETAYHRTLRHSANRSKVRLSSGTYKDGPESSASNNEVKPYTDERGYNMLKWSTSMHRSKLP